MSELLKTKESEPTPNPHRYVDCNNPVTWDAILAANNYDSELNLISDPDSLKENFVLTNNKLNEGETLRLPNQFIYSIVTKGGVKIVKLQQYPQLTHWYLSSINYNWYTLLHIGEENLSNRLNNTLFLPKYLVHDPNGIGDFERLLDTLPQDLTPGKPRYDYSRLSVIDWRSYVKDASDLD